MKRLAALAAIGSVLLGTPVFAEQEKEKPAPVELVDALIKIAKAIAEEGEGGGGSAPESSRAAKQTAAPTTSKAGGTVVDAPSFVQLVGLAVDNELLGFKSGALTFDLNLFAFKALADPAVLVTQERYDDHARLRRFGGALTVGGKGEEFDRDGDGKKDSAQEAANLHDIVSGEVRWRVRGTRDRRDRESVDAYVQGMKKVAQALDDTVRKLANDLLTLVKQHDKDFPGKAFMRPCAENSPDLCLFSDRVEDLTAFAKDKLAPSFDELAKAIEAYETEHKTQIKAIDRQSVWTAVVNGRHQGADYGPNRFGLGIRGVASSGAWDHTINLDWKRANWRADRPIATSYSVGYAASRLLSRDPDAELAPKLTFAVNGERFQNVPGALHDAIITIGVKLDVPFSESVSVPFSVTYASHDDLLTDQKRVAAHVGLAWDFSGLTRKKEK